MNGARESTTHIVLVCGGRGVDAELVFAELNKLRPVPTHILHGTASGADTAAGLWATAHGIHELRCPALWVRNGLQAGPIRNAAMLALRPDLVIAFPGGRGTTDLVSRAHMAAIPVQLVLAQDAPRGAGE